MKVSFELSEKELAMVKDMFAENLSDKEYNAASEAIDNNKDAEVIIDFSIIKPEIKKGIAIGLGVLAVAQLANIKTPDHV